MMTFGLDPKGGLVRTEVPTGAPMVVALARDPEQARRVRAALAEACAVALTLIRRRAGWGGRGFRRLLAMPPVNEIRGPDQRARGPLPTSSRPALFCYRVYGCSDTSPATYAHFLC
jgi:hypothetical protein